MGVFLLVLLVPFAYLLSTGALEWGPVKQAVSRTGTTILRAVGAARARRPRPVGRPTPRPTHPRRPHRWASKRSKHNFLTRRVEDLVNWARKSSVWPATFGLACCAIEMMGAGAAHYDLSRWGMEIFRASPRQADLMIVAGRVSQKMAPVLRQVYDQMVEPKWVISMGVCASTGGMFNNYAIVQGVDQVVPVDVYVPGCPPGPETLMHGILTLHDQIQNGEIMRRRAGTESGGAAHRDRPARRRSRPRSERRRAARCLTTTTPLVKQFTSSTPEPVPSDEVAAALLERFPGSVFADSHGQAVVYVGADDWHDVGAVPARRAAVHPVRRRGRGRPTRRRGRVVPPGVAAERYEVVANFLSHPRNRRIRTICQLPATTTRGRDHRRPLSRDRTSPSARRSTCSASSSPVTPISPRILMPDDWIGHPLRKDDSPSRVPVTFKEDPSPSDERAASDRRATSRVRSSELDRSEPSPRATSSQSTRKKRRLEAQTDEGAQELRPLTGEAQHAASSC